jgi:hypothetical protein
MFKFGSPLNRNADRLSIWIALALLVAMLGQSVLPTWASMRSDTNPGLWNEICSVYGNRQIRSAEADSSKQQTPAHHVDCPLCLHIFGDIDLATHQASATRHLLFLNAVVAVICTEPNYFSAAFRPEARGPPQFN